MIKHRPYIQTSLLSYVEISVWYFQTNDPYSFSTIPHIIIICGLCLESNRGNNTSMNMFRKTSYLPCGILQCKRLLKKKSTYLKIFRCKPNSKLLMLNTFRLWWALWIGASFAACIFSTFKMYGKWDENPVTIVYGSELMPVSTVPFPAITICPLSKSRVNVINLTWALNIMDRNDTMLDEDSVMKVRTLAHVCSFQRYWKTLFKARKERVVETLRNITNSLERVMVICSWRSQFVPCKSIMTETLVDDGICFTFNSLALEEIYRTDQISPDFLSMTDGAPSSDWTREDGYRLGAGFNAYP